MSCGDYKNNRALADAFNGPVMDALKFSFNTNDVQISSKFQDTKQAADFIVGKSPPAKVAARVRNYEYWRNYKWDITVRSRSLFNKKTELDKILEGHGDYIFYGFLNPTGDVLHYWRLCDLNVFRWNIQHNDYASERPLFAKQNSDGTKLATYDVRKMKGDFVIESGGVYKLNQIPFLPGMEEFNYTINL